MTPKLLELLRALDRHSIDHVVVGGVAAILEGAPMTILDLDIVVQTDDDNLAGLGALLVELEARYRDPAGRLIFPTVDRLRNARVNLLETKLGLSGRHARRWCRIELRRRFCSRAHTRDRRAESPGPGSGGSDRNQGSSRSREGQSDLPLLRRTLDLKRRS